MVLTKVSLLSSNQGTCSTIPFFWPGCWFSCNLIRPWFLSPRILCKHRHHGVQHNVGFGQICSSTSWLRSPASNARPGASIDESEMQFRTWGNVYFQPRLSYVKPDRHRARLPSLATTWGPPKKKQSNAPPRNNLSEGSFWVGHDSGKAHSMNTSFVSNLILECSPLIMGGNESTTRLLS